MRSILNVSVILAANMEMFSNLMYILVKMDVRFYDYAINNHGQKTVFEWCAHFQSSGITEHNHNW